MSEILWFHHRTLFIWNCRGNRKYDETALSQQQVAQKLWYFQKIESVSGNIPAITKVELMIQQFIHLQLKNMIEITFFLNLLLNQFDKKMDLDPYNWELFWLGTKSK
jgi:methylmalonyl-CoA mutase